jgi:hypothetical protein
MANHSDKDEFSERQSDGVAAGFIMAAVLVVIVLAAVNAQIIMRGINIVLF